MRNERIKKLKLGADRNISFAAIFYTFSLIIVKGIGALYRLPLSRFLGAEGMGLYQLVFPLYALLLVVSGSCAPHGIARMTICGYDEKVTLKKSLAVFFTLGTFFSVVLFFASDRVATAQGDVRAGALYRAISPSIALSGAIACFRGALQGRGNYKPTAFSQIVEQGVKSLLGSLMLFFIKGDVVLRAIIAVAAITFSEAVAFCYIAVYYLHSVRYKNESEGKTEESDNENEEKNSLCKKIPKLKTLAFYVIPLAFSALILPLASFFDSFIAVNAFSLYSSEPTALYGLYSGCAETVIGLPVGAVTAYASACLPQLGKIKSARRRLILKCFAAGTLACLGIFLFAPLIAKVLFAERTSCDLLIRVLRFSSVNALLECMLAVVNVVFLSLDKQTFSAVAMFFGLIAKVAADLLLLKNPLIGVFGLIISSAAFYLVALIANLLYIIYSSAKVGRKDGDEKNENNSSGIRAYKRRYFGERVRSDFFVR